MKQVALPVRAWAGTSFGVAARRIRQIVRRVRHRRDLHSPGRNRDFPRPSIAGGRECGGPSHFTAELKVIGEDAGFVLVESSSAHHPFCSSHCLEGSMVQEEVLASSRRYDAHCRRVAQTRKHNRWQVNKIYEGEIKYIIYGMIVWKSIGDIMYGIVSHRVTSRGTALLSSPLLSRSYLASPSFSYCARERTLSHVTPSSTPILLPPSPHLTPITA